MLPLKTINSSSNISSTISLLWGNIFVQPMQTGLTNVTPHLLLNNNIRQKGTLIENRKQSSPSQLKKSTKWTTVEDAILKKIVLKLLHERKHNDGDPNDIATKIKWTEKVSYYIKNRNGKQCRERWVNHVNPEINKNQWSRIEDNILIEKHNLLGNKWSLIAKDLPGRPTNAVKNRWNSSTFKLIRDYRSNHSSKTQLKLK